MSTRWGSFNIGANESVQAHQPGASSRLLIRVDGGGATNIAGTFTSNGITILENRNGVQFSRGAIVNVGGLLATSSRIRGVGGNNWRLNGIGGAVVNHGTITAGAGGAILAAVKVQNTGDITAKGGDVALGAGSSFTVDFAGSMVGFEVKQAADGASIVNTGKIEAQGGVVALSAQEAQAVRTNVISVGGVVKATKIERRGGVVYLSGGDEGVAEVSGDVQADEKIQTTGEYVAVKEGAVLTAPDILVGGDFQGRGDVQTAQRTLVERGALLDAGAEGRVIVWSDEITWFNGNINVPGGFAEVSGKRNLATVNLPGIKVGASGTLLLDPWVISISATSDAALPADGFQFTDIGETAAAGTTTISATDVGNFVGALELQARRGLQIRANITSTTLTSLTLRAQDNDVPGGGDNTVSGPGEDANNIGFFGTTTLDLGDASLTLIAGVINIRNTATTTITARGGITFRFTRDGLNLATAEASHVTGFTAGTGTTLTYAFGLEPVADPTMATNCVGQTGSCSITRTNEAVTISSGNLTASIDLTVDLGTGDLNFGGTGPIIISAPTVSITAGTINITDRALTIQASTGTLTLNTDITSTGGTEAVNLGAVVGNLDFGSKDFDLALTGRPLTLMAGGTINFGTSTTSTVTAESLVLSGPDLPDEPDNVTFTTTTRPTSTGDTTIPEWLLPPVDPLVATDCAGQARRCVITRTAVSFGFRITSATLEATESIAINLGPNSLRLATSTGTGAVVISAPTVSITATSIDVGNRALTIEATGGSLTLTLIRLQGAALPNDQELSSGTRDLTISSTGVGAGIILGSDIELRGANIQLTGDIVGTEGISRGLDIRTASLGDLTLNSNINLRGGILELRTDPAGGNIRTTNTPIIIVGSLRLREGDLERFGGTGYVAGLFSTASSVTDDVLIRVGFTAAITIHPWMTALGGSSFILRAGGSAMITTLTLPASFVSTGSIELEADAIALSGDATTTLSGAAVTLTGDITGTGALNLTTTTGTLRLNDGIAIGGALAIIAGERINLANANTVITAGGAFTINFTDPAVADDAAAGFTVDDTATMGNLDTGSSTPTITFGGSEPEPVLDCVIDDGPCMLTTVGGADLVTDDADLASSESITIDIGGGTLTFGGGSAAITIEAPTVSITAGNIDIGIRALTITASRGFLLSLSTDITADAGSSAAVEISATGSWDLDGDINAGGGSLTLSAGTTGSITLVGDSTLTGGVVTLASVSSDGGSSLTVMATGLLTINDIEVNGGSLSLTAASISNGGSTRTLDVSTTISLTQNGAFADDLFSIFTDDSLTLTVTGSGPSTNQIVHAWMVGGTNRALSITTTGVLTIDRNINTGSRNLTLRGDTIALGGSGTRTLDGAAITLTGRMGGPNALTIEASGLLTLNSNIVLSGSADITLIGMGGIALGSDFISVRGDAVSLTGAINESTDSDNLTLTATDRLTLNSGINLGGGTLVINAGERINVPTASTAITAGTLTVNFTDPAVQDPTAGFSVDGASTLSNFDFSGGAAPGYDYAARIALDCTVAACSLGDGSSQNLFVDDALSASDSITIRIGTGTLTFDDGVGAITISSDVVSITAGNINIGTRALTITASNGALTLNANITGTGGGAVMLLATNGALTLGGDVDAATGALTLSSTGTDAGIMLNGPITLDGAAITLMGALTSSNNLTIMASGDITLNSSINLGVGNLTLTATGSNILAPGGTPTLNAGEISLTKENTFVGNNMFTIDASVTSLTLTVTGMGASTDQAVLAWMVGGMNRALSITTPGELTIGMDINTGSRNLTLVGDTLTLAGVSPRTLDGAAITLTGALTATGIALDITASGNITINNNINLGAAALTLTSTGANIASVGTPTLTASTVSLMQVGAFAQSEPFTFAASVDTLILRTAARQTLESWMFGTNRSLDLASTGGLGVRRSSNNDVFNIGSGTLTLGGTGTFLNEASGNLTLMAGAVVLNSFVDGSNGSGNFTITATGNITINQSINMGASGDLALTADTGAIMNGGDARMLTAGTVSLTQASEFAQSEPFTFGSTVGLVSFETTSSGQSVRSWMTNVVGRSLSIRSTGGNINLLGNIEIGDGDITLISTTNGITFGGARTLRGGAITLEGAISSSRDLAVIATGALTLNTNITAGALTLEGATIALGGSGTRTLTGAAVSLTGALTSSNSLTINAGGLLTLNSAINVGSGNTLTINAGALISVPNENTNITAGTFEIEFTDPAVRDDATGFGGTFGNLTGASVVPGFAELVPMDCIIAACELGSGTTENLFVVATLAANDSITINIGGGTLTFDTSTPAITITSDVVSITAGNIDIGNRALTITANTGALTLTTNITGTGNINLLGMGTGGIVLGSDVELTGAAIALTGAIDESDATGDNTNDALTITASGVLTLNNDINTGTGALNLTAGGGGTGNIVGVGTLTLTASTVSLTQAGVFASDAPFTFAADTLNLEVTAATTTDDNRQTVYGWMTDGNRALSLTSNRAILIGISAVNTAVSTGTGDLTLDGESIVLGFSGANLTGGNIELTGRINKSGSDTVIAIMAMGNLTLNSSITLGADTTLTLTAGMGGTGNIITDGARTFNATRVTLGQRMAFTGPTAPFTIFASELTLRTVANQTVYDWMAGGRALDLTSDGVITISGDLDTGGNALTLTGRSGITLGANAELTGGAITLSGEITGAFAFTVTALRDLTLNDNINIGTTAALSLTAGGDDVGGSLIRSGDADIETLTAGSVSLTQDGVFGPTALFTFATDALNLTTDAANQTVVSWMTSVANRALDLTSTGGTITVNEDIDTGTRALTLRRHEHLFARRRRRAHFGRFCGYAHRHSGQPR